MSDLLDAMKRCEAEGLPMHPSSVGQVRVALKSARRIEAALRDLVEAVEDNFDPASTGAGDVEAALVGARDALAYGVQP